MRTERHIGVKKATKSFDPNLMQLIQGCREGGGELFNLKGIKGDQNASTPKGLADL